MSKILYGTQDDLKEILEAEAELGSIGHKEAADVYAGMDCLEPGKLVCGKISQVNEQEVLVDVNFKSEGVSARDEFKDTDSLEIGTEIEVFVEKLEGDDGRLVLSKQKADFVRVWDRIHELLKQRSRSWYPHQAYQGWCGCRSLRNRCLPSWLSNRPRQIPDINALIAKTMILRSSKSTRLVVTLLSLVA